MSVTCERVLFVSVFERACLYCWMSAYVNSVGLCHSPCVCRHVCFMWVFLCVIYVSFFYLGGCTACLPVCTGSVSLCVCVRAVRVCQGVVYLGVCLRGKGGVMCHMRAKMCVCVHTPHTYHAPTHRPLVAGQGSAPPLPAGVSHPHAQLTQRWITAKQTQP